jgi:hypothetical protein
MSQATAVVAKFGGIRPMARKLGLKPSTVQGWADSGVIPARRHDAILLKALELNIDLQPSDFFGSDRRVSTARHADQKARNPRTAVAS